MSRPSNPRKPEKLMQLRSMPLDNPAVAAQPVPYFTGPKGIDRYNVSSRVDPQHAVKIRNFMFENGNLVSRLGTDLMGGNAASVVMQVVDLVRKGQKKVTLRFCLRHLEIFEYGLGVWRSFPIPLTGSERDFFAYTGWANKILFSNGVDGLWEFDFSTMEAKVVPGAPGAKHLTTFGNRVVASSTIENGADYPLRVRWSAKNIYNAWSEGTEADPVQAALAGGHEDLYGSPGGITDEAMGVFPFGDEQAWLIRSHSTWQMAVSGNALAPFRFNRVIPQVGTAYRNTIVSVDAGVVFASRDNVHYVTQQGHQLIGNLIADEVEEEVENLRTAYAAYDVGRQEYRMAAGSLVWRYRFVEEGWTADEYPYTIRSLSRQVQGVAGIPIDNLPGIIDELSANFPPGAINDLVYDRSFDNAMMFVPESTELTTRENDQPQDTLLTGEETDSELLLETGFVNLDVLKAIELHGIHGEYESEMEQELIFEASFSDGATWEPLSLWEIEATDGSEMLFVKQERVSRKLRLRLRSLTLGKLRLLGLAPILVSVERTMATRKPRPATIIVSPNPINLQVGQIQPLSVRVLDVNGVEITGQKVTLLSTDNSIATVSGTGVVRGIAPGPFAIVASLRNIQVSIPGTITPAVQVPVASIIVSPDVSQGAAGSQQQFTATLLDSLGNVLVGRTVVWASSNPEFATISSSGLASLVTVGVTAISATSEGVTGGATLTVTAIADVVDSVEVVPDPFTVTAGQTMQLTALPKDVFGNILSGKTISWMSSDNTKAIVNATGLVTGVAAGSVTITATCDLIPGTAAGTVVAAVMPVSTITVTPSSFSKAPGQTQALTVVLKDVNGTVLTGRVITFESSNTSIATVDSSGVVTAVAQGNATITVSSEGKNTTASATVTAIPVASVSVSPGSFSVTAGQQQQLTATTRDSNGNILVGRVVTWGSSDVTKATVSSSGLVTTIASGSVTITATSETKQGTSVGTIGAGVFSAVNSPSTVVYSPEPNVTGAIAGLPQVWINSTRSVAAPAFTTTLNPSGVPASDASALQAAINASAGRAGLTVIKLADGFRAETTTGIALPERSVAGSTIIEAVNINTYATEGSLANPSLMGAAPKIITRSIEPALKTLKRATNYRVGGIEFYNMATTPTTNYTYGLVRIGNANKADGANAETAVTDLSDNIVIDRCYIHGSAGTQIQHAVILNCKAAAVVDSWFDDIKWAGVESHGISSWSAVGPHKIVGNYMRVAAINILYGGADSAIAGVRPADIEIRRNMLEKNLVWKGQGLVIKNLFELKTGSRVLFEGNILKHSWVDGQAATGIVLQSISGSLSDVTKGWVHDVTIRYNWVDDVGVGMQFSPTGFDGSGIPMTTIEVANNLFTGIGVDNYNRGIQLAGGLDDIRIVHNTLVRRVIAGGFPMICDPTAGDGPKAADRLVIRDNLMGSSQPYSSIFQSGGLINKAALDNFAASYSFDHNVFWDDPASISSYPATNQVAANLAAVGFTDSANGDYSLSGGSPYKNDASDGTDPGANWTKLQLAISGVFVVNSTALPVVPGLVGFGTTTRAARGGTLRRVTNLNDSGAGSLRAALTAGDNSIICFEVSGTISLASKLVVTTNFLTIAGQTAPAPGILLRNYGISFRGHDVVMRHIRIRVGKTPGGGNNDPLEILGPNGYNIVLDHCSFSWATDENFSTWMINDPLVPANGAKDITINRCIMSENLDTSTGGGALVGDYCKRQIFIGCLLAHNQDRNPYFKGGSEGMMANSVIYNWNGNQAAYHADPEGSGSSLVTILGSRFVRGLSTDPGRPIKLYNSAKAGTLLYVSDNSDNTVNGGLPPADPWTLVQNDFGLAGKASSPPVFPDGFVPQINNAAMQTDLLAHVGAWPTSRDTVDTRIVADVGAGTGTVITDEAAVGGYPVLANNTRTLESIVPPLPASPNADDDQDGYTNVEEWLNNLANSIQ